MTTKQKIYEGLTQKQQASYHKLTDAKKDEYMESKMDELADKELKEFEEKLGFKFTKKQRSVYVQNMKAEEGLREYKQFRREKALNHFLGFDSD